MGAKWRASILYNSVAVDVKCGLSLTSRMLMHLKKPLSPFQRPMNEWNVVQSDKCCDCL